jgi:NAD+ synthase (glutamine-hydrolysing)
VADPEANAGATLAFVGRAGERGAQVLVLPELGLTGYTCGDLFFSLTTLVAGAERALERVLRETAGRALVVVVGLPVLQGGRLFNAAAVLQGGRLLGVVPKTFLPGYKEYYEERWFSSSREARESEVRLAGQVAPFGTDLLFQLPEDPGVTLAVEICEDLWAPIPPSSRHAVAGATVILNPSASNDLVAKAEYRRELVRQQSGRTLSAYVYANAGVHESTTDLVFGGHLLVAENGALLAEGERFRREGEMVVTDVDVERLRVERARQTSFADAVHAAAPSYRTVPLAPVPPPNPHRLVRAVDPRPFVPGDTATLDERCREVFSIQTAGLARRIEHVGVKRVVLGLSGGLDSTLALLVCVRTFDLLGVPRAGILAVTMPGFGTTARTLESARRLAAGAGVELREIDIRPACAQHIRDIGLDPEDRTSATYENLQARERTQVLMDLANKEGGLVVGTGDLSEIALGWATFAGDHIAMYSVNSSVPKTLVRRLVEWVAAHHASGAEREVLEAVLATPVSPELLPPGRDGEVLQKTEDLVGPYELHDFFLFCLLRWGAGPRKVLFLAGHAFAGRYDEPALRGWLVVFLRRFFAQQWKRSVMPDGPKVGSVSLSPRGDWRMPSDARPEAWLRELEE